MVDDAGWEDDDNEDNDVDEPECCLRKMLARQSDFVNEKSLLYQVSLIDIPLIRLTGV